MKKWIGKILGATLVMTMLCSGTSLAQTQERQIMMQSEQESSTLLSEDVKVSVGKSEQDARSKALALALCTITNKENGILNIYAETTTFIPVDWAGLTVYLDKWNEDTQMWNTVEMFEKEFTPEDREDGILHSAELSVDVGTQPAGYYYRARCIHELEYDGGWFEAKATETDGILLTNIYK